MGRDLEVRHFHPTPRRARVPPSRRKTKQDATTLLYSPTVGVGPLRGRARDDDPPFPLPASQATSLLPRPDPRRASDVVGALRRATTVALAVAVVALLVFAAQSVAPVSNLRAEDFFTVDRCVVYTFYPKGLDARDALVAGVWRKSWKDAGWKPVVLDERHAALHPRYEQLRAAYLGIPSDSVSAEEKTSSYVRHLALAAVGGGWLTEPDVFNVNLPPPPKCDWLPNGGEFTVHIFIPDSSLATPRRTNPSPTPSPTRHAAWTWRTRPGKRVSPTWCIFVLLPVRENHQDAKDGTDEPRDDSRPRRATREGTSSRP